MKALLLALPTPSQNDCDQFNRLISRGQQDLARDSFLRAIRKFSFANGCRL